MDSLAKRSETIDAPSDLIKFCGRKLREGSSIRCLHPMLTAYTPILICPIYTKWRIFNNYTTISIFLYYTE